MTDRLLFGHELREVQEGAVDGHDPALAIRQHHRVRCASKHLLEVKVAGVARRLFAALPRADAQEKAFLPRLAQEARHDVDTRGSVGKRQVVELTLAHASNLRQQFLQGARRVLVKAAGKDLADDPLLAAGEELVAARVDLEHATAQRVENEHAIGNHVEEAPVARLDLAKAPVILLERLLRVDELLAQVDRWAQVHACGQHRSILTRAKPVLHGHFVAGRLEAVDHVESLRLAGARSRQTLVEKLRIGADQDVGEGLSRPRVDDGAGNLRVPEAHRFDGAFGGEHQREVGNTFDQRRQDGLRLFGEQKSWSGVGVYGGPSLGGRRVCCRQATRRTSGGPAARDYYTRQPSLTPPARFTGLQ